MTAPKRRWFRFSLATLFVVLTVLGLGLGWLGYQLNWIRERHAFLAENEAIRLSRIGVGSESESDMKAPGLLWLFGEVGHLQMVVCVEGNSVDALPEADHESIRRSKRLFPELHSIVVEHVGPGEHSFSFLPQEIFAK